ELPELKLSPACQKGVGSSCCNRITQRLGPTPAGIQCADKPCQEGITAADRADHRYARSSGMPSSFPGGKDGSHRSKSDHRRSQLTLFKLDHCALSRVQ